MSLSRRFRWFLAPSIVQACLSVLSISLATNWLGPADYGVFALITSYSALGCAICNLGSSFTFAKVHSSMSFGIEMKQAVTQQVMASLLLAAILAILLIYLWPYLVGYSMIFQDIPESWVQLSAFTIIPLTIWALGTEIITLDGRAKLFAFTVITHSIFSTAFLFVLLYYFELGPTALFLSNAINSIILGFGGFLAIKSYLVRTKYKQKNIGITDGTATITLSNFLELVYHVVEKNLLSVSVGFLSLGLYTHSQLYRGAIFSGMKALTRTVWPIMLKESEEGDHHFPLTNFYWTKAYIILGAIGIVFALYGSEITGLFTNGKFSGSGFYVSIGILLLIVQSMGKPGMAFIYNRGKGQIYAKCSVGASLFSISIAFFLIPFLEIWGAFLAAFIYQVILRISVHLIVAKTAEVPFQSTYALTSIFIIIVLICWKEFYDPSSELKVILCAAGMLWLYISYLKSNLKFISK